MEKPASTGLGDTIGLASQGAADVVGTALASSSSVLVARQPIFDRNLEVVAYELLYRVEGEDLANVKDDVQATTEVLARAILDFGLDRLVGSVAAFVNFPAEFLESSIQVPLPSGRIVIELLEGAPASKPLLDELARLRAAGYRIALDDFDIRVDSMALLEHADVVKVDIRQYTAEELVQCVAQLGVYRLQLVAEKVETCEEYERCRNLGFDLFQGFFLQRPELFREKRVPDSRLAALQVMLSLEEQHASAEQIEMCIARDVGLGYRLLRCINSSYYSTPRKVDSIRQAVLLLGFEELRKICSIILLTSMEDRPAYLAVQALTRAKMCESLCARAGCDCCDICFLAGLLSVVDILLGIPLEECLRRLPLSDSLRDALLRHEGAAGAALRCATDYERSRWDRISFRQLPRTRIADAYAEAVQWAEAACAAWGVNR